MKITIEIPDEYVPAFGASLGQGNAEDLIKGYFERLTKEALVNLLPEVDQELKGMKETYDAALDAKRAAIQVKDDEEATKG